MPEQTPCMDRVKRDYRDRIEDLVKRDPELAASALKEAIVQLETDADQRPPNDVRLSAPLIVALELLANLGGEASVSEMGLVSSVYCNFALLRFFDLIEPVRRDDGTRVRGRWSITPTGVKFLTGKVKVKDRLWRRDGYFVRWHAEAEEVAAEDVLGRLVHPDPASPIWH